MSGIPPAPPDHLDPDSRVAWYASRAGMLEGILVMTSIAIRAVANDYSTNRPELRAIADQLEQALGRDDEGGREFTMPRVVHPGLE